MRREIWRIFVCVAILFAANIGDAAAGGEGEKLPHRAVARLGSTAFAQEQVISAVALSANGKLAAAAGSGEYVYNDGGKGQWNYDRLTIRLWDVPTGRSSRQIPVPEGPALALDFSPDGKSLAASAGKKVLVWDVASGKEIQRIRLDGHAIQVRFASDGKHLFVNLFNKEILKWDLEKRAQKVLWDRKNLDDDLYVVSLDLSPDGTRLGILLAKEPEIEKGKPVVDLPPHRLEVLDLASGKQLYQAESKALTYCLALSPDNKTVAYGTERLAFWDIASKMKRRELAAVPARPFPPSLNDPPAKAPATAQNEARTAALLAYSPNGKLVVSAYRAGFVSLWNAESGAKVGDYVHPFRRPLFHASDVLAFSGDSAFLALGGSQVLRVVDTATGKEISPWPGHRVPISDIRYSPDGRSLFTINEAEICAWNAKTWTQRQRHDLVPLQRKAVLASSLEKSMLITWTNGEYRLEDLSSGKVVAKFPTKNKKFNGAGFSFEGKTCCLEAFGDSGDLSAVFFSIPECKELFQLNLAKVQGVAFSPVRNAFNWTDQDGVRFEADGLTGKITKKLDLGIESFDPDGPPSINLSQIYSWDGKYLLTQTADAKGQSVRIWDVDAGRTTHRLQFALKRFIGGIDFTFDSRLMVYTQSGRNGICVLELASGKERRSLIAPGQPNPSRVVTSPGDFVIAAGMPGNTVMVWDLARPTGKQAKPRLTDQELNDLWIDLADANAINAEDAIDSLVRFPAQTVAFLRDRLKPIKPLDDQHVARLIADVGNGEPALRDKAIVELEKHMELVEPALRQTLAKKKPPAEIRRRIEELLGKPLPPPDAVTLRALRALETLEKIGTPDARAAIEPLTRGAASARLTQEAAATLKRLDRQK